MMMMTVRNKYCNATNVHNPTCCELTCGHPRITVCMSVFHSGVCMSVFHSGSGSAGSRVHVRTGCCTALDRHPRLHCTISRIKASLVKVLSLSLCEGMEGMELRVSACECVCTRGTAALHCTALHCTALRCYWHPHARFHRRATVLPWYM